MKRTKLSLEQKQGKNTKNYYHTLTDINTGLAKIHKGIYRTISEDKYKCITGYVNKYISYTTVWDIKFIYNLESIEVALLQIFHLEYIFEHESEDMYKKEKLIFLEKKEIFMNAGFYTHKHIEKRKKSMYDFMLKCEQDNE